MNTQILSPLLGRELSENKKRQITAGMQRAIEQGHWVGVVPLGYRTSWRDGMKIVVVDPLTASLIQEAFCWASQRKYSLRFILAKMTERGLVSRQGKPLTVSALHHILTNPFYVGKMEYKGRIWFGQHEAIIDEPNFQRVQENLARRRRR